MTDTVIYLEFVLDSRYSWMEHLDMVKDKIHDFTINIINIGYRHRGQTVNYLKISYNGVIEKQIT